MTNTTERTITRRLPHWTDVRFEFDLPCGSCGDGNIGQVEASDDEYMHRTFEVRCCACGEPFTTE